MIVNDSFRPRIHRDKPVQGSRKQFKAYDRGLTEDVFDALAFAKLGGYRLQ